MAFAVSIRGDSLNVKCKCCGKQIDRNIAYKVTKGRVNSYYCSETEYNDDVLQKSLAQKDKSDTYELIEDIIGKTTNTILFKEVQIWLSVTNYKNIASYLLDNKQYLINTMQNKSFNNEYGMIRYFSAIVKNNISSYKPSKSEPMKQADVEIYETKFKLKPRRKCLTDYEDGEEI